MNSEHLTTRKKAATSRDDFRKVLESQGFLCFYCGSPIVKNLSIQTKEATPRTICSPNRVAVWISSGTSSPPAPTATV